MSEKKGILNGLFGKKEKSGCCNMEIVEETEEKNSCCSGQNAEKKETNNSGCCSGTKIRSDE